MGAAFVVVSFQLLLIGGYFHHILSDTLNHQVSARAVIQAREIASDPQLIEAVSLRDTARVQKQIKRLQGISDANFIVVGDSKGIRLAHPDIKKLATRCKVETTYAPFNKDCTTTQYEKAA